MRAAPVHRRSGDPRPKPVRRRLRTVGRRFRRPAARFGRPAAPSPATTGVQRGWSAKVRWPPRQFCKPAANFRRKRIRGAAGLQKCTGPHDSFASQPRIPGDSSPMGAVQPCPAPAATIGAGAPTTATGRVAPALAGRRQSQAGRAASAAAPPRHPPSTAPAALPLERNIWQLEIWDIFGRD
jgi:hypothetical protein